MKQLGRVFLAAVLAVPMVAPTLAAPAARAPRRASLRRASLHRVSRFRGVPTFADSTLADIGTFDDPIVRAAAVEGLGRYNGAVVAVDPNTGRILTVVNQKIAFGSGYIPCSTINTMLKVGRRKYMNLTEAMAHSNNVFFEELGRRMGFDTVSRYARLLGLGELAGYNLPEEHPGSFPMQPPAHGGIARMSSFGEGIQITPFQLASLAAAFANGGTLYYLQYPRTAEEIQNFAPRIKRDLNIATVLPEIREGMLAAVLYGTGKRSFDRDGDEMPLGKTGTCNDPTSRVGWFVTYADEAHPKIALAVLLRGSSRQVIGPTAALVAGRIYRRLREQNYFSAQAQARRAELKLLSTGN